MTITKPISFTQLKAEYGVTFNTLSEYYGIKSAPDDIPTQGQISLGNFYQHSKAALAAPIILKVTYGSATFPTVSDNGVALTIAAVGSVTVNDATRGYVHKGGPGVEFDVNIPSSYTVGFWYKGGRSIDDGRQIYTILTHVLWTCESLGRLKDDTFTLYVENVNFTCQKSKAWHLHVATIDGSTVKYYVDGAVVGGPSTSSTTRAGGVAHAGYGPGFTSSTFDYMDDFVLFDKILSATEITSWYTTGTIP